MKKRVSILGGRRLSAGELVAFVVAPHPHICLPLQPVDMDEGAVRSQPRAAETVLSLSTWERLMGVGG